MFGVSTYCIIQLFYGNFFKDKDNLFVMTNKWHVMTCVQLLYKFSKTKYLLFNSSTYTHKLGTATLCISSSCWI